MFVMKFQKISIVSFAVFVLLYVTKSYGQNDELHCFVAADSDIAFVFSAEPKNPSRIPMPEVNVLGNGMDIDNNTVTFSGNNNTDFGTIKVGAKIQKTFVIQNLGKVDLNIGDPAVSVSDVCSDFNVLQPEALVVLPGKTTVFTIAFSSNAVGDYTETVKIYNDDEDESVYTFKVKVAVEK